MTHTETPWATTNAKPRKITANGILICNAALRNLGTAKQNKNGKGEAEAVANAARIVHCVNTHDALVKALEGCIPSGVCLTNSNMPDDTIVPIDATMGELRAVAAALALAKGEGE